MMHAWYDVNAPEPTVVTTAAELDAVLDRVAALDGPTLVTLLPDGDASAPDLSVGLYGDRGTLRYAGGDYPNGCFSKNTGHKPFDLPEDGEVIYFYMMSDNPYPADAEVPIKVVREAAHEFMRTNGALPTNVAWTVADGPL